MSMRRTTLRSTVGWIIGRAGHTVATNRRARFDYELQGSELEAGLVLQTSEVKALRAGHCDIAAAHVGHRKGELYLYNAHIPCNDPRYGVHEAHRARKLLTSKRERLRLMQEYQRNGMSIVPLRVYFNNRGYAKVAVSLARGKKSRDKRQAIRERDLARAASSW